MWQQYEIVKQMVDLETGKSNSGGENRLAAHWEPIFPATDLSIPHGFVFTLKYLRLDAKQGYRTQSTALFNP